MIPFCTPLLRKFFAPTLILHWSSPISETTSTFAPFRFDMDFWLVRSSLIRPIQRRTFSPFSHSLSVLRTSLFYHINLWELLAVSRKTSFWCELSPIISFLSQVGINALPFLLVFQALSTDYRKQEKDLGLEKRCRCLGSIDLIFALTLWGSGIELGSHDESVGSVFNLWEGWSQNSRERLVLSAQQAQRLIEGCMWPSQVFFKCRRRPLRWPSFWW